MGTLLKQILRLFFHNFRLSKKQSDLVLENLALRQQLSIYHHTLKRPKIRTQDRIFWVLFSKIWKEWRDALIVVKPETVILWHKKGFKLLPFISIPKITGYIQIFPDFVNFLKKRPNFSRIHIPLSHACQLSMIL